MTTGPRQRLRRIVRHVSVGTLFLIAAPIVVAILWLRFFGLPNSTKTYLLGEIQRRHVLPYPLAIDRLLLSPTGALLADHVTVYRDATRQTTLLYVDQVRVGVAWLSWWRGRGIVNSASIANAEVRLPIGPRETAEFQNVNARFAFDGHDIRIENAEARFLNLQLTVSGIIHNDGFEPTKKIDASTAARQIAAREDIFRSAKKALGDLSAPQPLDFELAFETTTRDLVGGRATFSLEGQNMTWRGAPVAELGLHGTLGDGVVNLNDFKVALDRGELTAHGDWNLAEHAAQLQFSSSMDFTTLAPAFPGALGNALGLLDFSRDAPSMNGRVLFDLQAGFHADVQADLDWRNFTFNGVDFAQLTIPLAYDGKRLLIPGLNLAGDAGNVDLEFYYDDTQDPPNVQGKIDSTLDPTILKGVFGAVADNFLASCSFPKGGPQVEATAAGTALKTDAWTIKGHLAAHDFVYKTAAFDRATSDFTFADSKLDLLNLDVRRPEGAGGGRIVYDFKNRVVELHNLVSQVNIAQVAPIMGGKFTQYTSPYRFDKPPLVHANGLVDLQDKKKDLATNLVVDVVAKSAMGWTLFHIPYVFDQPVGTLTFKNRRLAVNMKQSGFYGGSLTGVLNLDLRPTPANYDVDMTLAKVDFQKFMLRSFNYGKSTGTLDASGRFSGSLGVMTSLTGKGTANVDDGDITSIPLLGSLTPFIPGLSAADEAHGGFTIANGLIHTDDLEISSETLALLGNGNYNFVTDRLDLNMRVNTRVPLVNMLTYVASKIFEFHANGTMKDPQWAARNF
jgi:uncharacterized protein involved in outer membrane biogenesis